MIMEVINTVLGKFLNPRGMFGSISYQYQLCMGLQAEDLMVLEVNIFKCFPIISQ